MQRVPVGKAPLRVAVRLDWDTISAARGALRSVRRPGPAAGRNLIQCSDSGETGATWA